MNHTTTIVDRNDAQNLGLHCTTVCIHYQNTTGKIVVIHSCMLGLATSVTRLTYFLNFLATGDYPEGLSRDEKRNYRRKAKSFETKGDKTFFYIQGYRSLIFRCNLCYQRRKNAAYYLSLQHCLPHLTLSGKRKLYVATIEGILIVFLFKIISSFIFAYENYLVHVYVHVQSCVSVHVCTHQHRLRVGRGGSFYFVTPARGAARDGRLGCSRSTRRQRRKVDKCRMADKKQTNKPTNKQTHTTLL